jgi:linoleoyl-CoA desaturase
MSSKVQVRFTNKSKSAFFTTLKKRIDEHFNETGISKHANSAMVIKTIVLLSAYILPFVAILLLNPPLWASLLMWTVMGFGLAGMGMSVMHDANHGAYSENAFINKLVGHSLNLAGGSVVNWKLQHNILHHTYTNVAYIDDDIADKAGMLRFSPHTPVKGLYRFQFIYAFLFYGILTLYWALAKDFAQLIRYTKNGVNKNNKSENIVFFLRMILDKSVYFFVFLVVPTLFFHISFGEILGGFVLMHFFAGLVLTVIFQLAHTVEETSHPLPNESGNIENDWAIHQLNTTVNFSRGNKFLTWYLGGLNYQVEHHLFPKICHVHYPAIAPIVQQTAEEFGIPYLENETFQQALMSHVNTLKRFGTLPSLNEALA